MATSSFPYDFLLILDFEATCDDTNKGKSSPNPIEIIEIPVIVLNCATLETVDQFHKYVRPVKHPLLTEFCTDLTGISQETVNSADPFTTVFPQLTNWVENQPFFNQKWTWVTCGDWDLRKMLKTQCKTSNIPIPDYMRSWINIKQIYRRLTPKGAGGMMRILNELGIDHTGRHHSGIDDCRNIVNITIDLIRKGVDFHQHPAKIFERTTSQFPYDFLLILDFEATCDDTNGGKKAPNPQEIIEIPVIVLNCNTLEIVDQFHKYVRPVKHPLLTAFCTDLTGISQGTVDSSDSFPTVFHQLCSWLEAQPFFDQKWAWVTCGQADFRTFLKTQCRTSNVQVPGYMRSWINIKKIYRKLKPLGARGMMSILDELGIDHVGRHHSGIDDCRNIVNITIELIRKGADFNNLQLK